MVPAIPIADGLHEGEVFSASFAQRAWQASLSSHDMPWAVVPAVPDTLEAHQVQEVSLQGSCLLRLGVRDGDVRRMPKILCVNGFPTFTHDRTHSKIRLVRNVGRKNVGRRPLKGNRMREPGKNLLLPLDGDYWEPYRWSHLRWPGSTAVCASCNADSLEPSA